jgi:hypothetical protein
MSYYTVQVSDHDDAKMPSPVTAEAGASWVTVFDGKARRIEVEAIVAKLGARHKHVRTFKGSKTGIGRLIDF